MRRRFMAAASSALLLLTVGGVAPVAAWPPTEIYVTPATQYVDGCQNATAFWNVGLDGGAPGTQFTVSVTYGDGGYRTKKVAGTTSWSYQFLFYPCQHYYWTQAWTASRSGGGTGYATTHVDAN